MGQIRSLSGLLVLLLLILATSAVPAESSCGCDLAYGSYYLPMNSPIELNLSYISSLFNQTVEQALAVNPKITNKNFILSGTSINISFSCNCLSSVAYLGHSFSYIVQSGDNYTSIAETNYVNLTNVWQLQAANNFSANKILDGASINVPVNCSCGDKKVSKDYGLFVSYPLQLGDNLSSVAAKFSFPENQRLLLDYNPGVDFSSGEGVVFIPTTDAKGNYPTLQSSGGLSGGAIAGICIAVLVAFLVLVICIYYKVYKRKKGMKASLLPSSHEDNSTHVGYELFPQPHSTSELGNFNVDKSVEFSYEELATATNNFSMTNKIGQGGFGAVYYAELRGEKAAIKKMDMEASKEFFAELKVLTHVHHLNLVCLKGYCIKNALFLVYEYIDNGNLSQHLRGSGTDPLPWSVRVQIALDSARGLEYIHEHTVPVYIHRDVKSANILIDKNFRAKVADFGLTKLTQVGNESLPSHLIGTFGYMPPEYAQFGDFSPKVDVFAFGVVLYELISAKEAIVKSENLAGSKGLVSLFEGALSQPDPREHLQKLVDPRLGDYYPIDSVLKMARLAKFCTDEEPAKRPSMRSVVVALMTLSSSTGSWDVGNLYGNQAMFSLKSGR